MLVSTAFSDIHKLPVCYCCRSEGMLCEVYVFRILLKVFTNETKNSRVLSPKENILIIQLCMSNNVLAS